VLPFIVSMISNNHGRNITRFFALIFYNIVLNLNKRVSYFRIGSYGMKRNLQGHYEVISTVGEKVKAFVPVPFPPQPPIDWTPELRSKFDQAHLAEGFPLSLRLIREIHEVLLSKGRGSRNSPGGFRRSQNWIGGTRPGNDAYVPPPAEQGSIAWADWSCSCTISRNNTIQPAL
jgi:hypothetical protein